MPTARPNLAPLGPGRIFWAIDPGVRGSGEERPMIVTTRRGDILRTGQVFAVVCSTAFEEPIEPDEVRLPFDPEGRCVTRLREDTVVVCTWTTPFPAAQEGERAASCRPRCSARFARRRASAIRPSGSRSGQAEGSLPIVGRLFAGTPFDRPPMCERCGQLEAACSCPPAVVEPVRIPPAEQTARLKLEKRPKGKVVTAVAGLDPAGNDLADLAARLKSRCGSGGTVKDGVIELQGDRLDVAEAALRALGYKVRRG